MPATHIPRDKDIVPYATGKDRFARRCMDTPTTSVQLSSFGLLPHELYPLKFGSRLTLLTTPRIVDPSPTRPESRTITPRLTILEFTIYLYVFFLNRAVEEEIAYEAEHGGVEGETVRRGAAGHGYLERGA